MPGKPSIELYSQCEGFYFSGEATPAVSSSSRAISWGIFQGSKQYLGQDRQGLELNVPQSGDPATSLPKLKETKQLMFRLLWFLESTDGHLRDGQKGSFGDHRATGSVRGAVGGTRDDP